MANIVALSGGESSAAVAVLMAAETPTLYFNDTRWEHPDLYRYLNDIANYLGLPLVNDSDGRDPAQVARDQHMLPNNRAPICSRILKAERLQRYAKPGDTVCFGIGAHEIHRAGRILAVYAPRGINPRFPLIEKNIDAQGARAIMAETGIRRPELYALGFEHNNCSGGCVRQGARQWRHLLRVSPEVYAEREALEAEFSPHTYLKGISLAALRKIEESQLGLFETGWGGECIGACMFEARAALERKEGE